MKTNNLILTSTLDMNPEEWLAFRQPLNHVKTFLAELLTSQLGSEEPILVQQLFKPGVETYSMLQGLFESDEWNLFQFPTVGGSEIASVVGLNPYKSIIELYYEKVGVKPVLNLNNAAMYWGKTLEATIAEQWQYWEGSSESIFENFASGKIVRKCRRLNAYIQNKKFPWIFVSLDRVINKYSGKEEGSLECKTISGYSADQWENGIPPMYVGQLQTQLAVCEFDHGEMAILKDGRDFQVYPFDYAQGICERLKAESYKFFQMVKRGIEQFLLYQAAVDPQVKQDHISRIDNFSPEPDGSLAYESYLKGAYNEQGYEIPGGQVELHLAYAYKHYDKKIGELEGYKRECSNKLKAFIKDAAKIDLGADGFVSWKANIKGSRVFLVKVNPPGDFLPDPSIVKSEAAVKIEEQRVPFD